MKSRLNYGCIERNNREYRKALRQCRKNKQRFGVAFDDSETWNMDLVVLSWCYGRNIYPHPIVRNSYFSDVLLEDWIMEFYEKELSVYKVHSIEYNDKLKELINSFLGDVFREIRAKYRDEFCDFILPRLKRFKEISLTFPSDLGIESWARYIQEAIDEIENEKTFDKFVDRIDDFWW